MLLIQLQRVLKEVKSLGREVLTTDSLTRFYKIATGITVALRIIQQYASWVWGSSDTCLRPKNANPTTLRIKDEMKERDKYFPHIQTDRIALRFAICTRHLWTYKWIEHQTSRERSFCSLNVQNSEGIEIRATTIFSSA